MNRWATQGLPWKARQRLQSKKFEKTPHWRRGCFTCARKPAQTGTCEQIPALRLARFEMLMSPMPTSGCYAQTRTLEFGADSVGRLKVLRWQESDVEGSLFGSLFGGGFDGTPKGDLPVWRSPNFEKTQRGHIHGMRWSVGGQTPRMRLACQDNGTAANAEGHHLSASPR